MNNNGGPQRHWLRVSFHFTSDALIIWTAFLSGMLVRFGDAWLLKIEAYYPSILLGSLFFASATYIFGLYSQQSAKMDLFKRSFVLAFCLLVTIGFMVATFYVNFSGRIGRGVMLISVPIAYALVLVHHAILLHRWKNYRERVAFIASSPFDEMEIRMNQDLWKDHLEFAGIINDEHYKPSGTLPVLGHVAELGKIVDQQNIDRVVCTNKSINDPALCKPFCELRYSGTTVMSLISLCEEVHQNVPLELITPEWLLNASGSPHILYIKKLKRGFDIVASIIGLVFLSPFMLGGMLATWLTSRGPVFYRQTRSGRFGRSFEMIKIRTMQVDAEKEGAVWAAAEKDPRATPMGGLLRKYRIDEIPQLINVLRGEMSLVGPRPERPEFIDELAGRIPFYQERLMVQPGITGWAQVNYPYGASADDARRKLEFDLYYMKHMSVFLDSFILLDTVRIILRGGLGEAHKQALPRYETTHRRS